MAIDRVLVLGAGGALGLAVVEVLRQQNITVLASYRTPRTDVEQRITSLGAEAIRLDISDDTQLADVISHVDAAIFTPILTVSMAAARHLRPTQRAVFFSSNNVEVDPEAEVYAQLLRAEAAVLAGAKHATIIRPTMIYGYPGDGNLSRLMQAMRRFPIAPIPGSGTALQQPVYFKSLAKAAVDELLTQCDTSGGICTVAGPSPVTQRALYRAVASAAGAKPILAPFPVGAINPVLKATEKLGIRLPISAAQAARAGVDKIPMGERIILTDTALGDGLAALAQALDGDSAGA